MLAGKLKEKWTKDWELLTPDFPLSLNWMEGFRGLLDLEV